MDPTSERCQDKKVDPSNGAAAADLTRLVELLRRAMYGGPSAGDAKLHVEGTDETGWMIVAISGDGLIYRVRVPDASALAALAGPELRAPRQIDPSKKYQTRTGPPLAMNQRTLAPGDGQTIALAGERAQPGGTVYALKGARFSVAAFTSRGPTMARQGVEYKAFNEDAVVAHLGSDRSGEKELGAIGAFDQAGGEGAVAEANGAASEAAATAFVEAIGAIERGAEPAQALRDAILSAERTVRSFNVGAMTTFAAVVATRRDLEGGGRECRAVAAVVGDSRVLLFDRAGNVKAKTALHNMGAAVAAGEGGEIPAAMALHFASALTRSIGSDENTPDLYEWAIEPGDWLAVETDGLGDARELEEMPAGVWHADRCAEDQGRIVAQASSAEEAVSSLLGYALDQMADRYGKPDNLAVAVLRFQ